MANWFRWTSTEIISSDLDGPTAVVIVPGNLVIESGCLVTTLNRCKGLHIQVMGDCFIRGTISMTDRGCEATGENLGLEFYSDRNLITYDDASWSSLSAIRKIAAVGGSGGTRAAVTGLSGLGGVSASDAGNTGGSAGTTGACGGGGSGGVYLRLKGASSGTSVYGRAGGNATCYSGGAASGGVSALNVDSATYGGVPSNIGGAGGSAYSDADFSPDPDCSGGGGNPGGSGDGGGSSGYTGTGGLLILSVLGHLYFSSTAVIESDGHVGRNAGSDGPQSSGGATGGGAVHILYGTLTDGGATITANGGAKATTGVDGGIGGAGTVRINSLRS